MFLIFTSTGVNASQELRGLSANNEESGNQIAVTRGANKKFQWALYRQSLVHCDEVRSTITNFTLLLNVHVH